MDLVANFNLRKNEKITQQIFPKSAWCHVLFYKLMNQLIFFSLSQPSQRQSTRSFVSLQQYIMDLKNEQGSNGIPATCPSSISAPVSRTTCVYSISYALFSSNILANSKAARLVVLMGAFQ